MPRMKDDERRIRDAISKLAGPPTEAEAHKLAKSLNTTPGRVQHLAKRISLEALPKRAIGKGSEVGVTLIRGRITEASINRNTKTTEASNAVSGQ